MRRSVFAGTLFFILTAAPLLSAQTADKEPSGPTIPTGVNVNPELLQLVIADQWDRGNDLFGKGQLKAPNTIDWKLTAQHDAARHKAVRDLLAARNLKTLDDFSYAALIFQHSSDPADLMMAHILCTTVFGMSGKGRWLMAATMDRYLHSIKQPQIFGTQFYPPDSTHTWTMEPYDRSSVTDAERALWCVIPIAEQEKVLEGYKKKTGGSTQISGCN